MDDNTRAALDTETPVNPYSLLDALNTAAARANRLWLLFLALMAYLALAVGALTHRDLLLDSGIVLPLLQTRIDLSRFFLAAPAILALAHLVLVAQFALLARKAVEFHNAVRLLEGTDLRSHPLRLELDSFFFVQALAGPERSRVVSAMLHGLAWLTLLLLPLALLIYLQAAFLPFHDATVTTVQQAIVLADIVLVLLAGVFLLRAETSFPGALVRLGFNNPGSLVFGLVLLAAAGYISLAATASGSAATDRTLLGLFPRHLEVADASLVADKAITFGGRTISLRGRDLRFARLDRADLRQADLTGARLDGASLAGADLRGARLGCARAAALREVEGGRMKAGCTTAKGADFSGAQLGSATLAGADLRGARFDDASLERADLSQALMAGAVLDRAKLQRATLTGSLRAASLVEADLQGATLDGARLEMADLSGARLQGASLAAAHLGGAVLREANLEGAALPGARLYGADLRGARLPAADLAGAMVWRTVPPAGEAVMLADIADIAIKPPAKADIAVLKAAVASAVEAGATGERIAGLEAVLAKLGGGGWEASAEGQAWAALLRASEAAMADGFKTRLARHLGGLACRGRSAGAVAAAVVRRALGKSFKGDAGVLYDSLKAADCPAVHTVPRWQLLELAEAAETARKAQATELAVEPAAAGAGSGP